MMFGNIGGLAGHAGGRAGARRLVVSVAWLAFSVVAMPAVASTQNDPPVTVTEENGTYSVATTFTVPQGGSFVLGVLTDYAQIPRFMPEVRTSNVLERGHDSAVVEQEAVARF